MKRGSCAYNPAMQGDLEKILIPPEAISKRLDALAAEMGASLPHRNLVLMPVLTGGLVFAADLMRRLPNRLTVSCVGASSYAGARTTSSGEVHLAGLEAARAAARGKHVLLIDDILDTGRTLGALGDALGASGALSVKTCVLLRKDRMEAQAFPVDFVAFDIPDAFVVGYGLDFNGLYRNLPGICTLTPAAIAHGKAEETP